MPAHPDRVRRHYDPQVDHVRSRLLGETTNTPGGVNVFVHRDPNRKERVLTIRIPETALQVARDVPALLVACWNKFERAIKDVYAGLYEGAPSEPSTEPKKLNDRLNIDGFDAHEWAKNWARGTWMDKVQIDQAISDDPIRREQLLKQLRDLMQKGKP